MLEDMAFYCIDNVPATLLGSMVSQIIETSETLYDNLAVGLDARNRAADLESIPDVLRSLQTQGVRCEVIFLTADSEILLRRYRETRRSHPLHGEGMSLRDAIDRERELLGPITDSADLVIDTTQTSAHTLRDLIRRRVGGTDSPVLSILVESFGYKHGVPVDVDFVFDLRCLPNPYWDQSMRPLTGKDERVIEYLDAQESVQTMFEDILGFLQKRIPEYIDFNRNYLTIGIGCTGGQHRSVYMANKLARALSRDHEQVLVRHSELPSGDAETVGEPATA